MRLKLLLLVAFAAGVFASIALADRPPGKGNPHATTAASTTGQTTTTTTTHGRKTGKFLVCHKLPHGRWVLVWVSGNSAHYKGKHPGDVLAGPGGTCPGGTHPTSTSTSVSTSTTTTTTVHSTSTTTTTHS